MASLEDTIHSAVPGGSVGKPLMLALLALLASGALFRGGGAGATTSAGPEPTSNEGTGGLLGGLGGLLDKLQKGGLGNVTNSWVGSGQNQPVSPGQLGPALGSEPYQGTRSAVRPLGRRAYQTTVSGFAWCCGQADPCRPTADISGTIQII
jgi:hypothetical protein